MVDDRKGYVLLSRKITSSEIFEKPPLYLKVWIYLLSCAQYKDYKGLKRGQLWVSIDTIREDLSWYIGYRKVTPTKDEIFNVIDWLRFCGESNDESDTKATMITTTKATRGLVVNIENYAYYQDFKNYESNDESNDEKVTKATMKTDRYQHDKEYSIKHEYKESNLKDFNTNTVPVSDKDIVLKLSEDCPTYSSESIENGETKNNELKKKSIRTLSSYGEYKNVKLTEEEYMKLGNERDEYVQFLDEYIEEKSYKSKNHNLAIRRWVIKAVEERKMNNGKQKKSGGYVTTVFEMIDQETEERKKNVFDIDVEEHET